jgi:hypothetical protein
MNINDYTELFRGAFEPLRAKLNQQAEQIRQGHDPHNQFSPWLVCTGKGGSHKPEYLAYPDISLYRHCMDVATVAFMLFTYAWQAGRLAGLSPADTTGAQQALRNLLAIAFLHDADKYRDQDGPWSSSHSPEFPDVQKVYEVLEVSRWTNLSVQDCFALVSRVETNRGKPNALFAPPPSDLMTDTLAAMVAEGDKLTSIASYLEPVGTQGPTVASDRHRGQTMSTMVRRLIDTYNDPGRLRALVAQYAVPNERLRLLEFRQTPVVLYYLRDVFLEELYYAERFPLICLLDGERFSISVPEGFDPAQVFINLSFKLAHTQPSIKRNPTNGELSLLHIHDVDTLIKVAIDHYEPRVLTVHTDDWDTVMAYIRGWVGAVSGLAVAERSQVGKLLMAVNPHPAAAAEGVLPERYTYALAIACALRSDAKGKLFEERLQRLQHWQEGKVQHGLQSALPGVSVDKLDKNTRQALYAMQAAMEIASPAVLHTLVTHLHESFPDQQADTGTQAIVDSLKSQCGIAVESDDQEERVYTSSTQGGTCLLTGAPATQPIRASSMTLAGIKTSAFNNRMGHRKSLWSQADHNYLSEAAIKQQALLCETLTAANKQAVGQPLLIAMPFRSVFKPLRDVVKSDSGGVHVIDSFMAVKEKDAGWKQVLPWELDVSESMPLMLETVDTDFDSRLHTMYRMAVLALYSGDPVHVFISTQRDIRAAFAFEYTPPLLQTLLRDLTVADDLPGTIRRDKLPDLVQRLALFREVIATAYGHDVLSVLPAYGWWTIAWFQARLIQDDKSFDGRKVSSTREVYPMEQDAQLERIAELATYVQRYPGRRASNNDRTFALATILEPFNTGKQHGQAGAVTIAAMAETLEQSLERRDMYARGEGRLVERCHVFAQEVYAFMIRNTNQGRFDGRFHRFMLAAYAYLFMAKHGNKSSEEETA